MIGKFIPERKISNRKWHHLIASITKYMKEDALLISVMKGDYSDERKEQLIKEFTFVERYIKNGRITSPRKQKKVFKRYISSKYNAYLLVLQKWENLSQKEENNKQESTESPKEQL